MAKRTADLIWVPENRGERELPPRKRTARPPALPLYKASVKELTETGTIRVTSSTADIDNVIVLRIKKCLERANHPNTLEAEAKAAIHLASRLMGRYYLSFQLRCTNDTITSPSPPLCRRTDDGCWMKDPWQTG